MRNTFMVLSVTFICEAMVADSVWAGPLGWLSQRCSKLSIVTSSKFFSSILHLSDE